MARKNLAYLPLGFLADNHLIDVNFDTMEDALPFQNRLFSAATGIQGDVWSFLEGKNFSISGTSVSITSQNKTGYCAYRTASEKGGTITYKYIADRAGFVCIDLNLSKKNSFSFWKNGIELYSETYSIPQSLAACEVEPNDIIEVHLTCNPNEQGTISLQCGVLNSEVFWNGYDILKESTLELSTFQNTLIEGTIYCNRNGVLYTSIPQNGNWRAYVDNKEAPIVEIGNAMVGLLLPEGNHTVRFVYHNAAFALGWKISLACFLIFIGLAWSVYLPKKKKGRYEQ